MFVKHNNPTELAKEIFWLAWQACGGPMGMGVLQDRSGVTREDVWKNISTCGDYPFNHNQPDNPRADYVFGRMMKLGLVIKKDGIELHDVKPTPSYQSWCRTYRTVADLVNKAVENMSCSNN